MAAGAVPARGLTPAPSGLPPPRQSVGDCDLNPLTRNPVATPAAVTNLTTMALKVG
jgi:hypothetical protein